MISGKLLRQAAEEVDAILLAAQPGPEECQHKFSRKFERKMRWLVRRTDHPFRYWAMQGVAAVLAVVLLGGGTVLAFGEDARETFIGWVQQITDREFIYRFIGEVESIIPENTVYRPAYVPDGYELLSDTGETPLALQTYLNKREHRVFSFTCLNNADPGVMSIGNDGTGELEVLETEVNGYTADLYLDHGEGDSSTLTWHDEARGMRFTVLGDLPAEELVKIAESVEAQENLFEPTHEEYRMAWLPEDYELGYSLVTGLQSSVAYKDSAGTFLTLSYHVDPQAGAAVAEQAGVDARSVIVNGNGAQLYLEPDGESTIVWTDRDSGLVFWVTGQLGAEDMIRAAEGVERRPDPVQVFRPHALPEGYQLLYDPGPGSTALYVDETLRRPITLSYAPKAEPVSGTPQEVFVHEAPAALYLDEESGVSTLVWYYEREDMDFTISGAVSGEALIQLAEAMTGKEYMPRGDPLPKPTWVPAGYEEQYVTETEYRMGSAYQNGDSRLLFSFESVPNSSDVFVPPANLAVEDTFVGACAAQLYLDESGESANTIMWTDENYDVFWITGHLDAGDLIRMAQSVAWVE